MTQIIRRLIFCSILFFTLLSLLATYTKPSASSQMNDYHVTGSFVGVRIDRADSLAEGSNILRWWSKDTEASRVGQFTSPEFLAPRLLSLDVSGYPDKGDLALVIQHSTTEERRRLVAGGIGDHWQRVFWKIPQDWVDEPIRLQAIDASEEDNAWLGVSAPLTTSWLTFLAVGKQAIGLWLRYSLHFCLLFIPGLVIFERWFESKTDNALGASCLWIVVLAASLGYLAFWIYWINHDLGIIVSSILLLTSVIASVFSGQTGTLRVLRKPDIAFPLSLMYLTGLLYLSLLYLFSHGQAVNEFTINSRFLPNMPIDNILPMIFSDRLYFGKDPRPLLGTWQSSDRPPLQSGVLLLQSPLVRLIFSETVGLSFQLIGTISQCTWVAAVWALCRQLKLRSSNIAIVMCFCIFSGFFLLNSLFIWPKLLAAALCSGFIVLILQAYQNFKPSLFVAGLAGISAGLGLMAHSGVVFTLIPTLLIMLALSRTIGKRQIILTICAIALVIAPWIGYQKLYEPPGNRLVKWHLAGAIEIDDRSTSEALIEEYQALGFKQSLSYKMDNFERLLDLPNSFRRYPGRAFYQAHRVNEFFVVIFALGILNTSWILIMLSWFRNTFFQKQLLSSAPTNLYFLPTLGLLSLGVWCLLMFGPATTSVHQGSYATLAILFVGLSIWLTKSPSWLKIISLGAQIALFLIVWLRLPPFMSPTPLADTLAESVNIGAIYPSPNWAFGILSCLSFVSIIGVILKLTLAKYPVNLSPSTDGTPD